MSIPSVAHVFESSLSNSPAPTSYLDTLIRQSLEKLAAQDVEMTPADSPPTPPPATPASPDSGVILNEIGDYFNRTAIMWSQLTESLLKGPHIDRAALDVHERARTENQVSDLSEVAAMDVRLGQLRKIRDMTAQFSREVQSVWHPETPQMIHASPGMQSSLSPFRDAKSSSLSQSVSGMSDGDGRTFKARTLLPDNSHFGQGPVVDDESGSDDSEDDDDEQFLAIDMEALRHRGKGSHYCPKGERCDKGGVDKEGNLVLFDRNSSFAYVDTPKSWSLDLQPPSPTVGPVHTEAVDKQTSTARLLTGYNRQHCNKHRKPWRCEVAGCPNPPKKRKFARRDGLERHKATVKHYIMPGA